MRLLEIRFGGEAIDRGRVPVTHLVGFLSNWRRVLQRTGRVLRGEARSVRPGQPPQDLKSELEFELVSFAGQGRKAVLGLERHLENASFPEMDFGLKVLRVAIGGLKELQSAEPGGAIPDGVDAGVLRAWRDAGVLFGQGIETIEFILNDSNGAVQAALSPAALARIRERLAQPQVNIQKIKGRLLMVDFTGDGARCRIHPDDGEPLFCLVDEERKDAVIANLQHDVVITGEVRNDPATGMIASVTIKDIERRRSSAETAPADTSGATEPPALLSDLDPAD